MGAVSRYIEVQGSKMHYLEVGNGDPILFLHGIPMSSYVWRNVIPHLAPLGRCIAPDLIGLGQSDKPAIEYTVFEHIQYIEKFIEALNLKNLTIIMHGWGSVIGFDYAMRHEKNCKGLVFYEAFLRSLENDDEVSLPFQEQLSDLQNEKSLLELANNGASFINKIISPTTMCDLNDQEMKKYQAPFLEAGASKPVLQYLKELPKPGSATKIDELITSYTQKLTHSDLPKLMMYSVPGFITTISTVMWAKENFPNIEIIDVGEELHLAQESNPTLMGEEISIWLQSIEQNA